MDESREHHQWAVQDIFTQTQNSSIWDAILYDNRHPYMNYTRWMLRHDDCTWMRVEGHQWAVQDICTQSKRSSILDTILSCNYHPYINYWLDVVSWRLHIDESWEISESCARCFLLKHKVHAQGPPFRPVIGIAVGWLVTPSSTRVFASEWTTWVHSCV
jgi:hypothetical protein